MINAAPPEEWRQVAEFPNYEASSLGRVRRLASSVVYFNSKTGRNVQRSFHACILRNIKDTGGYYRVLLCNGRRAQKRIKVSVLVCETFHGPKPSPLHECAHNDGDRTNDKAENLRWATRKENHADKKRHGTAQWGERCSKAKLTASIVVEIRRRLTFGELAVDIAREYGVCATSIYRIRDRQSWRHI